MHANHRLKSHFCIDFMHWKCQTNHSWPLVPSVYLLSYGQITSNAFLFSHGMFLLSWLTLVKIFVVGKYFDVQSNGLWNTICFEILMSKIPQKKKSTHGIYTKRKVFCDILMKLSVSNKIISLIKKEKKMRKKMVLTFTKSLLELIWANDRLRVCLMQSDVFFFFCKIAE